MATIDTQLTQVNEILKNYPGAEREKLIQILQEVQDEIGFLSRESVGAIGKYLDLPASKIFGVATFYNQFRFQPKGLYHIQVCRGTACHVKGSLAVLNTLKKLLRIQPGETSRDGLFSLEVVACIGACGLAPVISINGEFFGGVTADDVQKIINSYKEGNKK